MDNNIPVSSAVLSQFPEFAYPKYSKFITFIELYYQFLEQSKFKSFDNITSIDNNIDEFVEHIKYQLGINLPNTNSTDDAFFLHHIKEFYSTKGTEESFRILFRHLFGKEIDINDIADKVGTIPYEILTSVSQRVKRVYYYE